MSGLPTVYVVVDGVTYIADLSPVSPPPAPPVVELSVSSPSPTVNRLQWVNPKENQPVTRLVIRRPPDPDVYVRELDSTSFDMVNQAPGSVKVYEVTVTGPVGALSSGETEWVTGTTDQQPTPPTEPPTEAVSKFTGTNGGSYTQSIGVTAIPKLDGGDGSTETRRDVGTFDAVAGGIRFTPVKGLSSRVAHRVGYKVDGQPGAATFEFDPFWWPGPSQYQPPMSTWTVSPSEVQQAINSARPGDVIRVLDGECNGLVIDKRVTVAAVNLHGVKVRGVGADPAGVYCGPGSDGATIAGFDVVEAPAGRHGVFVGGATIGRITLDHLRVNVSSGINYYLTGAVDVTVDSCEGWKPDYSTVAVDINTQGTANLYARNCRGVTVRRSKFSGGDWRCVVLDGVKTAAVTQTWIENSRRQGAYNIGCLDVEYVDNRVTDCGEAGIQFNECFVTDTGRFAAELNTVWSSDVSARNRMTDPISVFRSGGLPGNKMVYSRNRTWHVGSTRVGSGGMTGDGGGGHIECCDNVVCNPGQTGLGIYGGAYIAMRRNRVYGYGPEVVAGGGQVGMYCWIGPTHLDTVGGRFYGRGGHVHDTNEIYFRRPDGTFNNVWIENGGDITGTGTNLLGNASTTLGLGPDLINQW